MLHLMIIAGLAHAATHAPGAVIESAVNIDITEEGFESLESVLPEVVPEAVPIDGMSEYSDACLWPFDSNYYYGFEIANLWIALEFQDANIVPQNGYLDLDFEILVSINDASDPFELHTELICIGDTCNAYVEPFVANVHTTIALEVNEDDAGEPFLDAIIGELELEYDLEGDDINLDDCVIGTIEDVFNWFGISMYDLILTLAGGALDDLIADMGPELETTIEDAFSAANIEQELALGDAVVDLSLYPSDIDITTDGMRSVMTGAAQAQNAAECIAAFDPGGSLATASNPPDMGEAPASVSSDFHAGIHIADDFTNQVLYALWQSGLLCYALTEEEIGIPLDTTILGLLAGDAFDDLFPTSSPLYIHTRPQKPPETDFGGDNDVAATVEGLGLQFFAELDHRQALILTLTLAADVGVDLTFDNTTGLLEVGIDLDTGAIEASVTDNQFAPGTEADIEANFTNVLDTLVGSLVGDALNGIGLTLPAMGELGLTDMTVEPAGDNLDWLGAYAWIGTVSYGTGEGCDSKKGGCGGDSGGCETTGCEGGGCGVGPRSTGKGLLLFFVFGVVARRRQQSA